MCRVHANVGGRGMKRAGLRVSKSSDLGSSCPTKQAQVTLDQLYGREGLVEPYELPSWLVKNVLLSTM